MTTLRILSNIEYEKDINRALRNAGERRMLENMVNEKEKCVWKHIDEKDRNGNTYPTFPIRNECTDCGGYNHVCKSYVSADIYLKPPK